ncbi:hypothetical protein OAF59_01760 [bacterium]|nr:hypothetical protein [bacterium]
MKDDDSSEQFHCNGGTYSFLGNPRPQLVVFLGIWVFYGLPWIAMAKLIALGKEARTPPKLGKVLDPSVGFKRSQKK